MHVVYCLILIEVYMYKTYMFIKIAYLEDIAISRVRKQIGHRRELSH